MCCISFLLRWLTCYRCFVVFLVVSLAFLLGLVAVLPESDTRGESWSGIGGVRRPNQGSVVRSPINSYLFLDMRRILYHTDRITRATDE